MDTTEFIFQILMPTLLEGLVITIELVLIAAPIGFLLGILLAIGRVYGSRPVIFLCKSVVGFIKGTPLLLMLFILYFGLPSVGITLSAFSASIVGFVMCNGAYSSEYIRGAIGSVKEGQMIAAQALGMTRMQAVRSIILPQALRRAIPGLSNEFIYLIKYSSLAYMLTVIELTGAGKLVATKYFTYTETFMVVGILYLVLVTITTVAVMLLERKLAVPGMTTSGRSALDIL
ncbi:amino acid ABC transporter permease [Methanomicrobiaceae archaeon CYW5]|uniref:amino acid ABC transporter permease n=1 Tax=Methanovulcanius yangii TaxID=1789227 RepID=UPI0029CA783B|nr:amino acid ABC transporter permease [Methanovulcanius yangii]MBT8507167.1 amino acid ABC transporter permease [Methanovulcanius yangii]